MIKRFRRYLLTASLVSMAASVQAADKIRWLNDWLPAGDKAIIYLAVEQGLFAAEDIDVEIMSGRGSSDVVTKLATGAADMGTGGLSALLQAKAGATVPVTAVLSVYTKQPDAVFVSADSGIETLGDLKGKNLATATFSASNVTWPLVLETNGMSPDDVRVTKVDPGAMGPMMSTGRVDGTINWITKLPAFNALMKQAGKEIRVLPWSDYGFDGYGLSVFASDRLIKEKPELVRKVLTIYLQAQQMAIEDPQQAGAALKAKVEEVDADVATEEFSASIPLMQNEISERDGTGVFNPALLATTWKWVAEAQGLPEDTLNPADAVSGDFISK
ncbi:NMT1/THI5-like domain-containing protein [Alloalcanivorax dieselolei B5]|uniref:NMT1/THI5-like domain-containing protein n=1 Tax=Alcanivorax dieselolei (strain DSM 16502 / CGMCC 1.3690 / MCCC 1A00001 / B-5) TaxID=930169 RepID=K0CKS7_ALCDB|nr:ABC transporter substrate-binding protein [Alloalcanivorax dieselolei]AFT72186.1 NMT1/THI5-like domain-containing protein [Alloalcanivorax dieselolei B5]GGJ75928.1 sulfonate ABC transporter substrate-binding protein [Alloalcanivorax dieselolei]